MTLHRRCIGDSAKRFFAAYVKCSSPVAGRRLMPSIKPSKTSSRRLRNNSPDVVKNLIADRGMIQDDYAAMGA